MAPTPLFSVVVPMLNAEKFVRRSLDSIDTQTFRDWELVVVDNGSADQSLETVRDWAEERRDIRFACLVEPLRGPGAARNTGIRATTGTWISFLDADDRWYPTKLQTVAKVIADDPVYDLICHDELAVAPNGVSRTLEYHKWYHPETPLFPQVYERNFLSPSAVVVKRASLLQAGLFDTSLLCCEDHDLWIRLARFVKPRFIQEVLGEYIEREGSAIRDIRMTFSCDVQVGKRHFDEYSRYVRHPYPAYWLRVLRSFVASGKVLLQNGRLGELFGLTRDAAELGIWR